MCNDFVSLGNQTSERYCSSIVALRYYSLFDVQIICNLGAVSNSFVEVRITAAGASL